MKRSHYTIHYSLCAIILTVLAGCSKPASQVPNKLAIEKKVVFHDYNGWVKDIQPFGKFTKVHIQGHPKDHFLMLDEHDSIISDYEFVKGLNAVRFLQNGTSVRLWNQIIEILDSANTVVKNLAVLPTWPSPTVYNSYLALTDNGFTTVHRYIDLNTNELNFRISSFSANGDSIGQKTFEYPHEKMSTVIDIASYKNDILILGTYGHSGIPNGYQLLYLNENLDTIWNKKIPNLTQAHYYSMTAFNDGIFLAYSANLRDSWQIIPVQSSGSLGAVISFTNDDDCKHVNLYKSTTGYIANKSYFNSSKKAKMAQLDDNANFIQELSSDIALSNEQSFKETATTYIVVGSEWVGRDYPAIVHLKK